MNGASKNTPFESNQAKEHVKNKEDPSPLESLGKDLPLRATEKNKKPTELSRINYPKIIKPENISLHLSTSNQEISSSLAKFPAAGTGSFIAATVAQDRGDL